MLTQLIDCDCLLGRPRTPLPDVTPCMDDLEAQMQRLGITRALVRHRACIEAAPELGNAALLDETRGHGNLLPVWYVTIDGIEGDFDPRRMVTTLLARGARTAWATTGDRDVAMPLNPWLAGEMLGALEEHRVPLLLLYPQHSPDTLHEAMAAFPQLPFILCQVPRVGRHPVFMALMKRHANAYLCANAMFAVHRGIEGLCRCVGENRILFGSGYPQIEGGASLAAVTYADVPPDVKEAIAWRNADRLLKEVRP